jgi:hypothetical protein
MNGLQGAIVSHGRRNSETAERLCGLAARVKKCRLTKGNE